jgi:uncharacterized damage-inducible protein DinB
VSIRAFNRWICFDQAEPRARLQYRRMKHARLFSRLALVLVMPLLVAPDLAAQTASIQMNLLADWTTQKDTLMKIAAAMPEDRLGYKPTPPQRNYGEQILHIAEANVNQMKRLASKETAPVIDMKATSRAVILKALEDSFDYGTAVIKEQTDQTMLQAAAETRFDSFRGQSTRARVVSFVMGHTWDIYGQMVVYLRLNGITPPASQRP